MLSLPTALRASREQFQAVLRCGAGLVRRAAENAATAAEPFPSNTAYPGIRQAGGRRSTEHLSALGSGRQPVRDGFIRRPSAPRRLRQRGRPFADADLALRGGQLDPVLAEAVPQREIDFARDVLDAIRRVLDPEA